MRPSAWAARLMVRHSWAIVVVACLFIAIAGVFGSGVTHHLRALGFTDPSAESTRAGEVLARRFHVADPGLAVIVKARAGTVDSPQVVAAGRRLTRSLASDPGVALVQSYWASGSRTLRSDAGDEGLLLAVVAGDDTAREASIERVKASMRGTDAVSTIVGGAEVGNGEARAQAAKDLRRSEAIAVPVTLVLLVLAFSGVVAATLPLIVGAIAVVGTLLVLRLLAVVVDVSVYALNLTTALGLGLGIDYALFIVSRYRDERRAGLGVEDALGVTLATAGHTVVFSAATVAASLGALLLFPEYLLRSFGYAGIAVVAVAAAAALVVLPAVLVVTDAVLDRWRLPFGPRSMTEGGRWLRLLVASVMRRPLPVALAVLAVLAVVCLPAVSVVFGLPDDRVLPRVAASRQAGDAVRERFPAAVTAPVDVVSIGGGTAPDDRSSAVYAAWMSQLPGVAQVDGSAGTYRDSRRVAPAGAGAKVFAAQDGRWFRVLLTGDPYDATADAVVRRIRRAPGPFPVEVTGLTAQGLDTVHSVGARLPAALALVAAATMIALFLMTGSVVIPVKALLLSAVSLSATLGIAVWVFQDGHLGRVLDVTATGRLDVSIMVLVSCLSFGLSMDYEVFLLSRITEEHELTGDTALSVARGVQRTGRTVTTAAGLLAFVFLALAGSRLSLLKILGWTAAAAVLLDATLIRALLLPSLMRLMGSVNWWAPAPLRALHARWGERRTPASDEG